MHISSNPAISGIAVHCTLDVILQSLALQYTVPLKYSCKWLHCGALHIYVMPLHTMHCSARVRTCALQCLEELGLRSFFEYVPVLRACFGCPGVGFQNPTFLSPAQGLWCS